MRHGRDHDLDPLAFQIVAEGGPDRGQAQRGGDEFPAAAVSIDFLKRRGNPR
jgi:hypothetical protein